MDLDHDSRADLDSLASNLRKVQFLEDELDDPKTLPQL